MLTLIAIRKNEKITLAECGGVEDRKDYDPLAPAKHYMITYQNWTALDGDELNIEDETGKRRRVFPVQNTPKSVDNRF